MRVSNTVSILDRDLDFDLDLGFDLDLDLDLGFDLDLDLDFGVCVVSKVTWGPRDPRGIHVGPTWVHVIHMSST